MATGGPYGAVTYVQMVDYVARVTDPMEEHMREHDTWHRDRLTAERLSVKATNQARLASLIAAAAVILNLVPLPWLHR